MKYLGRAKQRDENEAEIVAALEEDEYIVLRLDEPCDLLCQCPCGVWVPLEVKNPHGKNRSTDKQVELNKRLHRPIAIVHDVDEAYAAMSWDHACG